VRARGRLVAFGVASVLLSAPLVACFDLFHSTTFETACDLDAAACASEAAAPVVDAGPGDAAPDGPTNFCAWDETTARNVAIRACTWLGACAGALADDAFGPCVARATLAYDCAANPNRQVLSTAHTYWACLSKVATCADVETCVDPSGSRVACGASANGYLGCLGSADPSTFAACGTTASTPPLGSCAGLGQVCASQSTTAACGGASSTCGQSGTFCDDAGGLHDCDLDAGPFDLGVICTSFGAGACNAGAGACMASGTGTCTPTSAITCDGGFALGCPSGAPEIVDCQTILGVSAASVCDPSGPGRSWDVFRACTTSDSCGDASDSCSDGVVTGCFRGASIAGIPCSSLGLGPCTLVTYPGDPTPHAQCSPP
jgi:hypothetical protein